MNRREAITAMFACAAAPVPKCVDAPSEEFTLSQMQQAVKQLQDNNVPRVGECYNFHYEWNQVGVRFKY